MVDWARTIFTLRFLHYIMPASIGAPSRCIKDTTLVFDTESRYIIIFYSVLPFGWQRHVHLGNKISRVKDASENLQQMFPVTTLEIRFWECCLKDHLFAH